ncbi:hypothetical protein Glove_19g426 [Diversispora epigaea]|uniref:Uncharacterized protein n=1 Tax=Diversispora epigaea TaxID=1348612 RepID=A0A397JNT0_9GLOM|nr:hypothetical protein Glove_19g426 [Diversispora epigaea]
MKTIDYNSNKNEHLELGNKYYNNKSMQQKILANILKFKMDVIILIQIKDIINYFELEDVEKYFELHYGCDDIGVDDDVNGDKDSDDDLELYQPIIKNTQIMTRTDYYNRKNY